MSWTEEELRELGPDFLNRVLENMRAEEEPSVRFGETGEHIHPNYQIEYSNGEVECFRGDNHQPWSRQGRDGPFEEKRGILVGYSHIRLLEDYATQGPTSSAAPSLASLRSSSR